MEKFKELVTLLFESRDKATLFHFNTDSDSKHRYLSDYVENIVEYTDTLIEMYSGKYGLIGEYGIITDYNKESDMVNYFTELVNTIEEHKDDFINPNDTFLHSKLDDIIGEVYLLIYKLKELK